MRLLDQFTGFCNGKHYTYKLVASSTEYQLQSYTSRGFLEKLSWDLGAVSIEELNQLCSYIKGRK